MRSIGFRNLTVIVLLLLEAQPAAAQKRSLYITPAFDFGMTPNKESFNSTPVGPYYQTSIGATYMFNETIGITTGLGYSSYKYTSEKQPSGANTQKASYIEWPVAVRITEGKSEGKKNWMWIDLGAALAFNVSAAYDYEHQGGHAPAPAGTFGEKDNKNEMKPVLVRVLAGFGVCHQMSKNLTLQFGGQLSTATSVHAKSDAYYARSTSLLAVALRLGLMVRIGK